MNTREFWEFVFNYWTVTILLPTILLVMVALAVTTRMWDDRDHRRR